MIATNPEERSRQQERGSPILNLQKIEENLRKAEARSSLIVTTEYLQILAKLQPQRNHNPDIFFQDRNLQLAQACLLALPELRQIDPEQSRELFLFGIKTFQQFLSQKDPGILDSARPLIIRLMAYSYFPEFLCYRNEVQKLSSEFKKKNGKLKEQGGFNSGSKSFSSMEIRYLVRQKNLQGADALLDHITDHEEKASILRELHKNFSVERKNTARARWKKHSEALLINSKWESPQIRLLAGDYLLWMSNKKISLPQLLESKCEESSYANGLLDAMGLRKRLRGISPPKHSQVIQRHMRAVFPISEDETSTKTSEAFAIGFAQGAAFLDFDFSECDKRIIWSVTDPILRANISGLLAINAFRNNNSRKARQLLNSSLNYAAIAELSVDFVEQLLGAYPKETRGKLQEFFLLLSNKIFPPLSSSHEICSLKIISELCCDTEQENKWLPQDMKLKQYALLSENIGDTLFLRKRYSDAIVFYQKALTTKRACVSIPKFSSTQNLREPQPATLMRDFHAARRTLSGEENRIQLKQAAAQRMSGDPLASEQIIRKVLQTDQPEERTLHPANLFRAIERLTTGY